MTTWFQVGSSVTLGGLIPRDEYDGVVRTWLESTDVCGLMVLERFQALVERSAPHGRPACIADEFYHFCRRKFFPVLGAC